MKIHKEKFKNEADTLEYARKKFKLDKGDKYFLKTKLKKGKSQEAYGRIFFKNNGYRKLLSVTGNVHGFDGVLSQDNKIYWYESKMMSGGFGACLSRAEETLNNEQREYSDTRFAQLENIETIVKGQSWSEKELSFLDQIILRQNEKKPLNIPNERQLISIGSDKDYSRMNQKTKNKLKTKEGSIVIQYEEI